MKIGILCAGDDELAPFLPLIKGCCVTEKAMLKFYTGRINGIDVAALFSGVCKVNAAIASQLLIDLFGVDAIRSSMPEQQAAWRRTWTYSTLSFPQKPATTMSRRIF